MDTDKSDDEDSANIGSSRPASAVAWLAHATSLQMLRVSVFYAEGGKDPS